MTCLELWRLRLATDTKHGVIRRDRSPADYTRRLGKGAKRGEPAPRNHNADNRGQYAEATRSTSPVFIVAGHATNDRRRRALSILRLGPTRCLSTLGEP